MTKTTQKYTAIVVLWVVMFIIVALLAAVYVA